MRPIKTKATNTILGAGDCPNTDPMPVARCEYQDGTRFIESCWRAGWRERLRVLLTGRVYLLVMGERHPPVYVSATGDAPERTSTVPLKLERDD
jgi:hypothetical protein